MPRLSVWLIRSALLYLIASALLGGWLLAAKDGSVTPGLATIPDHAAMALLGWVMQLTLGVAYWMLPKFSAGPARGPAWPAWTGFVAINAGIPMVVAGGGAGPLATAGLALVLAGVLFVVATLAARIKPFGSRATAQKSLRRNQR